MNKLITVVALLDCIKAKNAKVANQYTDLILQRGDYVEYLYAKRGDKMKVIGLIYNGFPFLVDSEVDMRR